MDTKLERSTVLAPSRVIFSSFEDEDYESQNDDSNEQVDLSFCPVKQNPRFDA